MTASISTPVGLGRAIRQRREALGLAASAVEQEVGLKRGDLRRLERASLHIGNVPLGSILRALKLRLVLQPAASDTRRAA